MSPHCNPTENSFPEQKFSIPLCLSYENCKRPHRNYTPKRENCFAIFISVCNFHISLQFSYQFAILTFWCKVPTWTFAIFIWVCNFHMTVQVKNRVLLFWREKNLYRTDCIVSQPHSSQKNAKAEKLTRKSHGNHGRRRSWPLPPPLGCPRPFQSTARFDRVIEIEQGGDENITINHSCGGGDCGGSCNSDGNSDGDDSDERRR